HADSIERPICRTQDLRVWSLDDPNGRLLSFRSSAEYQDRLSQRAGHHNFIVNWVIPETMHRPADLCLLSLERASVRSIFHRQPGECRNLRMVDSVRYEDLLALTVVGDCLGLAESQRFLSRWRAADHAQGRHVA